MIARIESSGHLPTLPSAAVEYMQKADDPLMSTQRIARLIETDPTLTVKVLALANAPFYGYTRRISTIELAIAVLGANRLKEIVANIMMQALLVNIPRDVLNVKSFWRYSLYCAAAARYLARTFQYRISSEAFVAALLHDIGILVAAHCFPKDVRTINEHIIKDGYTRTRAERMVLGATHSDIGAWLIRRWNMPEQLAGAIQRHHGFENHTRITGDEEEYRELTHLVELTEHLAYLEGYMDWNCPKDGAQIHHATEKALALLPARYSVEEGAFRHLVEEIHQEYTLASQI